MRQSLMRLVVSLTTLPGRERLLMRTLRSLARQTRQPDQIYLWLPRVIGFQPQLKRLDPRVLVDTVDDLGPATKLLPILRIERDPDTLIVTADDDVDYPDVMLATLEQAFTIQANAAVGFTGWRLVSLEPQPVVEHYNEANPHCTAMHPVQVLEGTRGVLYKRSFFAEDVFTHLAGEPAFRYHDDIFFGGYLAHHGVSKIVRRLNQAEVSRRPIWRVGCQDSGLHTTPGWYALGRQCWRYWAEAFDKELSSIQRQELPFRS